jgi:alpha-N-arabinofuranosidase
MKTRVRTRARHLRSALGLLAVAAAASAASPPAAPERIVYGVDPARVVGRIDVGIYGQFLEHIFNSVHGGLWGDLLRNPSLETTSAGTWVIEDATVKTTERVTDRRVVFGDERWGDYEIELEARKTDGAEGFIVLFRVASAERFYWANLGGWQNREHGFEKARGPLGAHVRGSIEQGRWYQVRIRCEGSRYQAWLDGQKVLDATDGKDPILEGAIGLTGWDTRVEFRAIKVTSLDGRTLLEGLPPRSALAAAPAYWEPFGTADLSNDGRDPFNGRTSLRIQKGQTQGEAGIRQKPVFVRQGERYRGSLWLRGSAAGGVEVRLWSEDGDVVFRQTLRDVGAGWRRQTFDFTAPRTVADAAFELALMGGGDIGVDMVSLFSQGSLEVGGFRPDVLEAIRELKPASIRYPGGCFASAYRWKDGVGPREKRPYYPSVIWDDQDPNQMGTDEFMDLCRRVGAEPIIVINIGAGVEEALHWLEYCNGSTRTTWGAERAKNGHPEPYGVKLWEIDNETWGMGAERYAEAVSRFGRALRAKDPSIKIIACGGYGYDDGKGSTKGWNETVLEKAAKDLDYLSIHYYNGIMYEQDCVEDPRRYEAYMRDEIGGLIARSANPAVRIYCSEWGMMNDDWRSGLYAGGILNCFERLGELVPMTCPAVWLQTVSAKRPSPRWASCLILFDHQTTYGAPTWVVEKLWREHFAPKRVQLDGPERPLNTIATLSEDGGTLHLKTVNPTRQAVDVEVNVKGGFVPRDASLRVASAAESDRNSLSEPRKLAPKAAEVKLDGPHARFTMPPLSAGVLSLQSADSGTSSPSSPSSRAAAKTRPDRPETAALGTVAPAATIRIDLRQEKAPVPATLYGIFMEEISHAFDGGIYAELIRNRSFEEGVLPPGMKLVTKPDGAEDGARVAAGRRAGGQVGDALDSASQASCGSGRGRTGKTSG